MRYILILSIILLCFNNLNAQNNTLDSSQISCLNQTKKAFTNRIYYFLYKNDSLFEDSYDRLVNCNSLINNLNKSKLNKPDKDLFKLLSECIIKETSNTKEEIIKLSVGSKANTETDYGNIQMTDTERVYFTFLYIVIYKIDKRLIK